MISVWQVNFNNNKHTRSTVVKSRLTCVSKHQKHAIHIQLLASLLLVIFLHLLWSTASLIFKCQSFRLRL